MLHTYFDKVFLINLNSRADRLKKSKEVCAQIGLVFERYEAIPGSTLEGYSEYNTEYAGRIRWNRNAAALVATTYKLIKEASAKGYKSILIMEDDIEFREEKELRNIVQTAMKEIPADWEMLYFGATHHEPYEVIAPYLARVKSANACHCYAIHERAYDRILKVLSPIALPIDYSYRLTIHPRNKSYCMVPNIAYQFSGHSDLEGGFLDTEFMRQF